MLIRIKKSLDAIKTHEDLLKCLEQDISALIAHDMLITAWGDFQHNRVSFDVLSRIDGTRTTDLDIAHILTKTKHFYAQWEMSDYSPFKIETNPGFFEDCFLNINKIKNRFIGITNIVVHGSRDLRSKEDCLYFFIGKNSDKNSSQMMNIKKIVELLEAPLRRIHYPVIKTAKNSVGADRRKLKSDLLSERENDVMIWVIKGKSNLDIALILDISVYTVKNHIYKIYKKLNVSNRAQAVSAVCR
jgi:transcriptional regulator EpsA